MNRSTAVKLAKQHLEMIAQAEGSRRAALRSTDAGPKARRLARTIVSPRRSTALTETICCCCPCSLRPVPRRTAEAGLSAVARAGPVSRS